MRDIWKAEKFDLIKFKSQFHEDFMFIRETSLVDRDEFCAEIDQLMAEGKNNIPFDDMELIHENDDVTELRWMDGNERIVRINLKKDGLIFELTENFNNEKILNHRIFLSDLHHVIRYGEETQCHSDLHGRSWIHGPGPLRDR